jgi:hypothetical protein
LQFIFFGNFFIIRVFLYAFLIFLLDYKYSNPSYNSEIANICINYYMWVYDFNVDLLDWLSITHSGKSVNLWSVLNFYIDKLGSCLRGLTLPSKYQKKKKWNAIKFINNISYIEYYLLIFLGWGKNRLLRILLWVR